jgi:hypothetical protein
MDVLQGEKVALATQLQTTLRRTSAIGLITIVALLNTGCSGEEMSFCETAREFQTSIRQLDANEIAASLGPQFWDDLDQLLIDLGASEPEIVGPLADDLRVELAVLVRRLEANDYNVITAALDPESAEQLLLVASSLAAFAADELQTQISLNC